jgi:hypothetical protein
MTKAKYKQQQENQDAIDDHYRTKPEEHFQEKTQFNINKILVKTQIKNISKL